MNNPINYNETTPESFKAAHADRDRATIQTGDSKMLLSLLKSVPHDHPARIHVQGILFAAHDANGDFPCDIDNEPDYAELTMIFLQMVEEHGKRPDGSHGDLLNELP
jgi:hypothetical protein